MTNSQATEVLREPEGPRPVSYMELFFDLAFVVALTMLAHDLTEDLTVPGALRTLLLLAAVWWVWSVTAWSTDWFDPDQPFVRGLLVWVMFGSLLMAAAVPHAFGEYAVVFAGTYVAIHLGRGAALIYRLRGHPAVHRSARVVVWFVITGTFWITGALVPPVQYPLWIVAVAVDATIGWLGYPVPWLGRSTPQDLSVSRPHFTERYHQFVIVALGEFLLLAGLSLDQAGLHPLSVTAFVAAFAYVLLLTLLYYLPDGRWLSTRPEPSRTPAGTALTNAYLHLLVLAAVLTASAGHAMVIAGGDAPDRDSHRVVVVTGAALFLLWRMAVSATYAHRLRWWQPVGLLAVVALGPAGLPPIAASAIVDLVLLAVGAAEWVRWRRERATAPA